MSVEDISLTDWAKTFDVNVTGRFLCARRAMPGMKTQKCFYRQRVVDERGRWPADAAAQRHSPGLIEGDRVRRVIAAKAKASSIS